MELQYLAGHGQEERDTVPDRLISRKRKEKKRKVFWLEMLSVMKHNHLKVACNYYVLLLLVMR